MTPLAVEDIGVLYVFLLLSDCYYLWYRVLATYFVLWHRFGPYILPPYFTS